MRSIVIGLGETGGPLRNVLDCDGYDKRWGELPDGSFDVLNICIPYHELFINDVVKYQKIFHPKLVIIHTTVPIGTTSEITNAVHSPILGMHDDMEASIRKYTKWIGGPKANEAAEYLREAGINCRTVATSEETEALKLICLAKYGMSIAFAKYTAELADTYGFSMADVIEWDGNYNEHVLGRLRRPLIMPKEGKIGGHCVVQNTKLLNEQHPNPILQEILKHG